MKEGEYYPFYVEKRIHLPEMGYNYVVKDSHGMKYLLREEIYADYGIKPGTTITCKVDKINCRGEVFLEPDNPWFKESVYYPFKYLRSTRRTDSEGNERECLIVADERGKEHYLFGENDAEKHVQGEIMKLLVKRITKGEIDLSFHEEEDKLSHLALNGEYSFEILGIGMGLDGRENYIIGDPFGKTHIIPVRYYSHYGLEQGKEFSARIESIDNSGRKIIEPRNPFFDKGGLVEVDVISSEEDIIGERYRVRASDKFGFVHDILSPDPVAIGKATTRVIKMRKGKPVLEIVTS